MRKHFHGGDRAAFWFMAGRGGRGFGPFGHGFRGGGRGGRGDMFRTGRMLADGDLRLITLALLDEAPRHGYDIIKALEERSSGAYSPSPGVVYPTLTFLEEAGFATSASEGNKKVFSITGSSRSGLSGRVFSAAWLRTSALSPIGPRSRIWSPSPSTAPTPTVIATTAAATHARRKLTCCRFGRRSVTVPSSATDRGAVLGDR